MKKVFLFAWEIIKVASLSLAIILPIRYFLIQPFFVKGSSMEPNFEDGEYLVINEIGYRLDEPERGDVVVFRYPADPSQYYIKRVVGLPGETVEIKDNQITIYNSESQQGQVLNEASYLPEVNATTGDMKVELGQNEYFVLGDNRRFSFDSRQWGALEEKYIIGKVWIRAFPFQTAKIF